MRLYLILPARVAHSFLFVNRAGVGSMQLIRCAMRGSMLVIGYEELSPGAHFDAFSLTGVSFGVS